MTVCGRCASFGTQEWTLNQRRDRPKRRATTRTPRSEVEAAETLETIEDYGTKIRKTRQKAGISIEELARKIREKESVIKKLEKEELNPNRNLARKIKNALGLNILEVGETSVTSPTKKPATGRTLGDIWKLSQTKEEKKE
jgi:putative transcription factor